MAKIVDLNGISALWRKIKQTFYTKRQMEDLLGSTCVQEANQDFISIRNGDTQDIDFDINGATPTSAGVMSAGDKRILDYYEGARNSYIEVNLEYGQFSVTIGNKYIGPLDDLEVEKVSINEATTELAGVMSADDKAKADRILFGPDFVIGGGKPSTFYNINPKWNQFVTDNVVPIAMSFDTVVIFGTFSGMVYGTYQCIVNGFDYYLTLMGAGVGELCGGIEPSIITINGNRSNSTGIITWDNP